MKENSTLKPLSKAIYIIANVMKWIMIVCASFTIVAGVVCSFYAKKVKLVDTTIYLGKLKIANIGEDKIFAGEEGQKIFEAVKDFFNNGNNLAMILSYVFVGALVLVILVFFFHYLYKLFKNIHENDTPFTDENISIITKLAYVMLAYVCVPSLLSYIVKWIFKLNLTFDWGFIEVLCVLIIFAIKYIFEYGKSLEDKKKK